MALHAGQRRAETVMDAMPEGEVTGLIPVEVERLGARVSVRVTVRGGQADDDLRTGGDRHATECERRCCVSKRRMRHRCVVAEEFLHGLWELGGVGAELCQLDGVAEQGDEAVADEAGGCVVTGDDQLKDRREQLLAVESLLTVAGIDQPADEVVAGLVLLVFHECSQHGHDDVGRVLGRRVLGRGRCRDEQLGEPLTERSAVALGYAEELADDRERQREGEGCDQIDPVVGSSIGDVVEEVVRDGLDAWARNASTRRGEKAAETSRRSRVWSGGSTVSMCRAKAGPGRPSATTPEPVAKAACMSLESRRVVEGGVRLVVADHEPGVMPIGQRHRMHRAELCGPERTAGNGSSRSKDPHAVSASVIVISHLPGRLPCSGPIDALGFAVTRGRREMYSWSPLVDVVGRDPPAAVVPRRRTDMDLSRRSSGVLPLEASHVSSPFSLSLGPPGQVETSGVTRDNNLMSRSTWISIQYE